MIVNVICYFLSNKISAVIPESTWHLIFGGFGPSSIYATTVELYNWKSGEQCQLGNLPTAVGSHSGAVLDGIPIYCGGFSSDAMFGDNRCFKLDLEERKWIQVRCAKCKQLVW